MPCASSNGVPPAPLTALFVCLAFPGLAWGLPVYPRNGGRAGQLAGKAEGYRPVFRVPHDCNVFFWSNGCEKRVSGREVLSPPCLGVFGPSVLLFLPSGGLETKYPTYGTPGPRKTVFSVLAPLETNAKWAPL